MNTVNLVRGGLGRFIRPSISDLFKCVFSPVRNRHRFGGVGTAARLTFSSATPKKVNPVLLPLPILRGAYLDEYGESGEGELWVDSSVRRLAIRSSGFFP